jgi:uncharacterized protein (TIGR00730 family)
MSSSSVHAVTVYCSSSNKVAKVFADATAELGREIARKGWKLVYGGNAVGLMGVLADSCREAGGKVIGVTPRLFIEKGVDDKKCDEMIVTDGMRDRKAVMEERGDAFVALPGGFGTFEEFFEIICGRQLAYHNKAIVLLNVAGYYDPMLAMIERGHEMGFIRPKARHLYFVARNVAEAIEHLANYRATTPAAADLSFEVSPPPSAIE